MNIIGRNIAILYVEDDENIAYLTRDNLEMRGYRVDHVPDGMEALDHFRKGTYDLCLVDIMLPRLDGYSLAGEIRKTDPAIPILFISAKSLTEDKIRGFSLGADDYITKPYSIDELVMRIEVFLKRSAINNQHHEKVFSIGNTVCDFTNQQVKIGGTIHNLTQRENELLQFLLKHANRLVKREDILKEIWGDDDYFLGRSLDVFISRLRKIFSSEPALIIENVHGVGFRLNIP